MDDKIQLAMTAKIMNTLDSFIWAVHEAGGRVNLTDLAEMPGKELIFMMAMNGIRFIYEPKHKEGQ